ncbi:hypothetical protein KY289_026232 [Solanum tuberosum]|nr:hypothetical protein KY289_026232 [Solanum tuberosum]
MEPRQSCWSVWCGEGRRWEEQWWLWLLVEKDGVYWWFQVGREYSSLEGKRVYGGLELMLLRSGFPVDFRRRRRFGCHRWRSGSVGLIGLCLRLDFAGKGNRLATGK